MCDIHEVEQPVHDFKGVFIPKQVWFDSRLTPLEKIVLGEIDALDGDAGCMAKNSYIAGFCQCSVSKIEKTISKLKDLGYVWVESYDGRKRVLRSSLSHVNEGQNLTSVRFRTSQACGSEPHVRDGLINKLDTSSDTSLDATPKERVGRTSARDRDIDELVEYYYETTGRVRYKSDKKLRGHLNARMNDGFSKDQIKDAIRKKTNEVMGTQWEHLLRASWLLTPDHFVDALSISDTQRNGGNGGYGQYNRRQQQQLFDDLSIYDD